MEAWLALLLGVVAAGAIVLWRRAAREVGRLSGQTYELARAEQERISELERELHRMQPALASCDHILLVTDPELRLLFAGPEAVTKFGPPAEEASLFSYTQNLELERLAQDALETDSPDGLERIIRIEERPFQSRAVTVSGDVGMALTDVSELQRLSRARQDFIANLSHELNTPLTSLRLLADTLVSKVGKDPKMAAELADKIAIEADAVHRMSQEMLDLAAIESGQQVVRLVETPLHELTRDTIGRLEDLADRKQVSIEVEIDDHLTVLADPEQAGRAILNVLHNAVKYSPQGSTIEILAGHEPEPDMVVLTVSDRGPGIPPEELGRIFERFYRVRNAPASPGTGLGLAISHHIMRAHAGRIWAENRPAPEKGAVLHLEFQPA